MATQWHRFGVVFRANLGNRRDLSSKFRSLGHPLALDAASVVAGAGALRIAGADALAGTESGTRRSDHGVAGGDICIQYALGKVAGSARIRHGVWLVAGRLEHSLCHVPL